MMANPVKPPFGGFNHYLDRHDFKFAIYLTAAGFLQLIVFQFLALKPGWFLFHSITIAVASVCYLLLLLHTVFRIMIGHRKVQIRDVLFFILSYALLIVQFALYYECLYKFLPPYVGPVFLSNVPELHMVDFLYYSGVVMTTLGFGDIVPSHTITKLLAVFQAATGQIILILSIGAVIGKLQNQETK